MFIFTLNELNVNSFFIFTPNEFGRNGIFLSSILLIIPIRLPGYVIVLFIAIVSFIVSTILSKQLKRGGY